MTESSFSYSNEQHYQHRDGIASILCDCLLVLNAFKQTDLRPGNPPSIT